MRRQVGLRKRTKRTRRRKKRRRRCSWQSRLATSKECRRSLEETGSSSQSTTRARTISIANGSSRSTARCTVSLANPTEPSSTSRSEEHTSELQSQSNLVCRLLLEKKKKTKKCSIHTTY